MSPYNKNVVIVYKVSKEKCDTTHRICISFRRLNNTLTVNAEPIPRADTIDADVGAEKYISKLDFVKEYWQSSLSGKSKEKIAFATEPGCISSHSCCLE